ncbi:hypothetical protein T36_1292 [Helicobacter cinaedi]|uniref:hypothetical protein n=1 Tax=Helicobacter cinaedi TaxID=213 RepID=UPI001F46B4B1|nr:hypothetical protein [Helicobacter cinaedi]BDB64835.1 hypothetical protein T36_1292 [Helicobacter cinaedi]
MSEIMDMDSNDYSEVDNPKDLATPNESEAQDTQASTQVDSKESQAPLEQSKQDSKKDTLEDLLGGTPYHLRDGLENQNLSVSRLTSRAKKIKEELESGNSNEVMVANLNSFLAETSILEKEIGKLKDFFNKDLSLRDRQFVEKVRLIDVEIQNINTDLKKFLTQNREIKNFIGDIGSYIDNIKEQSSNATKINDTTLEKFEEINNTLGLISLSLTELKNNLQNDLEVEMTNRVESLSDLVGEFYKAKEEQKKEFIADFHSSFENAQSAIVQNIETTSKNIDDMLANAKKMVFGIGAILLVGGVATGAFSGLAYSKYSQYKDIESRLNEISSQLDGVKVLKNKHNDVVLVVPKEAKIESYGSEYRINLGNR